MKTLGPRCLLALSLSLAPASAHACTLWAEATPAGTLLSKNRDWKPDHTQVLRLVRGKGHAYFGLYAVGNDEPGLKQGVNQRGLCVVSATAGSIPKETRLAQSTRPGVLATLLSGYANCDEVLRDQEKLFAGRRPTFYLISDGRQVLTVEIGLQGRYVVKATTAGAVAHTNHFLTPEMTHCNLKIGPSSATRFKRISQLLQETPGPHTADQYAVMSKNRHAGVDDSLWRTGRSSSTLSSWILETPVRGSPRLRVVLANPGQPEETRTIVLDAAFWRGAEFAR